jgi:hypothetical protein
MGCLVLLIDIPGFKNLVPDFNGVLATEAALASHLLVPCIQDAMDLLLEPKRLISTLRS